MSSVQTSAVQCAVERAVERANCYQGSNISFSATTILYLSLRVWAPKRLPLFSFKFGYPATAVP